MCDCQEPTVRVMGGENAMRLMLNVYFNGFYAGIAASRISEASAAGSCTPEEQAEIEGQAMEFATTYHSSRLLWEKSRDHIQDVIRNHAFGGRRAP